MEELLKIAYESLCFLYPEYENDQNGKNISKILFSSTGAVSDLTISFLSSSVTVG